jgi:hypothetical protein
LLPKAIQSPEGVIVIESMVESVMWKEWMDSRVSRLKTPKTPFECPRTRILFEAEEEEKAHDKTLTPP